MRCSVHQLNKKGDRLSLKRSPINQETIIMTSNNYLNSSIFHGKLAAPQSFEINGLPPQNIEAEEAILGGILLDPDALNRVISNLNAEAFYISAHQLIYRACVELHKQGKPTDLTNIFTFLRDNGQLEQTGSQAKLAQLVDRTVSAINIDNLAELVMEKYRCRQIIYLSNELNKLGHSNHIPSPELLKEVENKALEIAACCKHKNQQHAQAEAELKKITRELEEIEAIPDEFRKKLAIRTLTKQYGLKTEKEFKDLHAKWLSSTNKARAYTLDEYYQLHGTKTNDWLLKGWIPENSLTVLHAMGGVGKTTLVSSICQRLLTGQDWGGYEVRRGKPIKILWIQTDQGPSVTISLFDRQGMFALTQSERNRLHILDQWGIEDYGVLEKELSEHKYDLVIIDSLTSVSSELIYRENDQEFARPLVRLRRIADKHNCAFLILHHSSKNGDLRGTTAIYNTVDQVARQERVKHPTDTIANLTLEKSRYRADHMTYRLEFNPDDHFWVSIGQVTGEGERETVDDVMKPSLKAICDFLQANEGVGFENEEISQKLELNLATCRKYLGEASREGLINSFRGNRSKAVYFVGQLQNRALFSSERPDPADPADPEIPDQVSTPYASMVADSEKSTDPADPQKNEKIDSETSRISGSAGSVDQPDQESAIAALPVLEEGDWVTTPDGEGAITNIGKKYYKVLLRGEIQPKAFKHSEIKPAQKPEISECVFKVYDEVFDVGFPHRIGVVRVLIIPKDIDTAWRIRVLWNDDDTETEHPDWCLRPFTNEGAIAPASESEPAPAPLVDKNPILTTSVNAKNFDEVLKASPVEAVEEALKRCPAKHTKKRHLIGEWFKKLTTPVIAKYQGFVATFYYDPSHDGLTGTVTSPTGEVWEGLQLKDWSFEPKLILNWLKTEVAGLES